MITFTKRRTSILSALTGVLFLFAWSCGNRENINPQIIRDKYGIADIATDRVNTPEGSYDATVVPITLANGQKAQLVIPQGNKTEYPIYVKDQSGINPVVIENRSVEREQFVRSRPVLVERRATPSPVYRKKHRSWEKEVLLVAGGAGAGAAIGGLAGGGKGAGIGALTGGVAGLVYDLATRHR